MFILYFSRGIESLAGTLDDNEEERRSFQMANSSKPAELAARVFWLAMTGIAVQIAIIVLLIY